MVFRESIEASDFLISINNFNFLSGEIRQGQIIDSVGDVEGIKILHMSSILSYWFQYIVGLDMK